VNVSRISVVHSIVGGAFELEMKSGTRLSTGRQYKSSVQALLGR
jgi:hypothetical protein